MCKENNVGVVELKVFLESYKDWKLEQYSEGVAIKEPNVEKHLDKVHLVDKVLAMLADIKGVTCPVTRIEEYLAEVGLDNQFIVECLSEYKNLRL